MDCDSVLSNQEPHRGDRSLASSSSAPPPPYTQASRSSQPSQPSQPSQSSQPSQLSQPSQPIQPSQPNHPVYGLLPYGILPPYYTNFFPVNQQANINTNPIQAPMPAAAAQPATGSANATNAPAGTLPAPVTASASGVPPIPHAINAPRRLFGPGRRRNRRDCLADVLFTLISILGACLLVLFVVSIVTAVKGKSYDRDAQSS